MDQIAPHLYLGGLVAAEDDALLQRHNIDAVVCCCSLTEFPESQESAARAYCRVNVQDMSSEPISLYFAEAAQFIREHVERSQAVLVHCRSGVSRSGTVTLAYFMQAWNYALHDAFFLVRQHRSVVTPNLGFMDQLAELEAELGMPNSVDLFEYAAWYGADEEERAAVPDIVDPDFEPERRAM